MGELVARPPIHTASYDRLQPDRLSTILLFHEDDPVNYRYKVVVVDRMLLPSTPLQYGTAAFLIPAGREAEYIFASEIGLKSIAESASTARLIAISFGRHHRFGSQIIVQEELSFVVQVLSRQGTFLPKPHQELLAEVEIPFMAVDGIGNRHIVAEGESQISGKYLVEQVDVDGMQVRRLYFANNPFVIQSEAVLRDQGRVDKSCSAFDYHKTMAAGILALVDSDVLTHGLLVGLGGGCFVNLIGHLLNDLELSVVELDPAILKIAEEHFDLDLESNRLDIRVGDGLEIMPLTHDAVSGCPTTFAKESMAFVAIDVDSKDQSAGMSCPPESFVEIEYLSRLAELIHPHGVLVMNISARDPEKLDHVCRRVQQVFRNVALAAPHDGEGNGNKKDINMVLFGKHAVMEVSTSKLCPLVEPHTTYESGPDLKRALANLVAWNETKSIDTGSSNKIGRTKTTRQKKKRGKRK
jgi:hypothetical protein|uniref:Spermidine synthase n=1 Tax=Phaeodactylum tricornutum TaxID=2850 RepID=A0A8J9SEZ8_PHATR